MWRSTPRATPTDRVVSTLAEAAGAKQTDIDGLIDALLQRREPFTIAVDALDEAEHPRALALTLRRLASETADAGVRLLVGSRRGGPDRRLLTALGLSAYNDDPALIDLDTSAYLSRGGRCRVCSSTIAANMTSHPSLADGIPLTGAGRPWQGRLPRRLPRPPIRHF